MISLVGAAVLGAAVLGAASAQEWAAAPPYNTQPAAAVAGLPPAQDLGAIAVMGTSCAVAAGEVWCWGDCSGGQCGKGGADGQYVPRKVAGVRGAARVMVTPTSACAHLGDGSVWCWGSPDSGLFTGKGDWFAPRRMKALGKVAHVAHGPGFLCAIGGDRKVRCLGGNYRGELGQGPVYRLSGKGDDADLVDVGIKTSRAPLVVKGVTDAVDVTAGDDVACALTGAGKVLCWGEAQGDERVKPERRWEDGVEVTTDLEPARLIRDGSLHEIVLPRPAIAISAVGRGGLALLDDHTVADWDYYTEDAVPAAKLARDLPPVRALGENDWFVITDAGEVMHFGNRGRAEAGLPAVVETSGSCARTAAGEVWCWGTNQHGELGRPATPLFVH